jgi:ribonuclease BN (tRNA processing enzyme)
MRDEHDVRIGVGAKQGGLVMRLHRLVFWLRRISMGAIFLAVAPSFAQNHPARKDGEHALSLVVLGSGGPGATGRAGAGYLVLLDGHPRILVDAGPGTFVRLGEAGLDLRAVDIVLLTHLHVDHAGELPGLVKARAVSTRKDIEFKIFGPEGNPGGKGEAKFPSTTQFVDLMFGGNGAFSYLHDFAGNITFKTESLAPRAAPQKIVQESGLVISAITGDHADAPSLIYRLDYAGKSITFSGDIDASGLEAMRTIARNSSLLIFNCVVLDPPGSAPILYTLHSPSHQIGLVAKQANVEKLLLSHLNPTIDENKDSVRKSISDNFKGDITFATDGLRVEP